MEVQIGKSGFETVSSKILRQSVVSNQGQISLWGTFQALRQGSLRNTEYWSPALKDYRQDDYRIKLWDDGCGVWVTDKEGKEAVPIPFDEIFPVERRRSFIVGWAGYLFRESESTLLRQRYETALQQIVIGNQPGFHDDGAFLKVEAELEGARLVVLDFGDGDNRQLVFTEAGESVDHRVCYPLAQGG